MILAKRLDIAYNTMKDMSISIDTLRIILYFASAAVAVVGTYSLVRHKSHLAHYFFFSALCAFLYVFGYASELGARSLAQIRFWLTVEYYGLSFIGPFWFLLSWKQWRSHNLRFRMLLLVFIVPAITLFLVTTQEYHEFYYAGLNLIEVDGHNLAVIEKGPWYWVQNVYLYVLLLSSFILQWRSWRRAAESIHTASFWMLIGTLNIVPWIVVYQLGLSPHGVDLGPFGITLMILFVSVAVFRYSALTSEEVLLYSIFASIEDAILVLDREDRISDFNNAAQKIFPWLNGSSIGKAIPDASDAQLLAPNHQSKVEKEVEIAGSTRFFQGRYTRVYEGHATLGRIYFFRDITERRILSRRLHRLANYDTLTLLYNRRRFMEKAETLLEIAAKAHAQVSFLMLDIDHFKQVNDRFGHAIGDQALSAVGRIIRRRCRYFGFSGRYGGDEFVVVLRNTDRNGAIKIAEDIRRSIEGIAIKKRMIPIPITISIGISSCETKECGYDIDLLLKEADDALYSAKSRGRNRVEG